MLGEHEKGLKTTSRRRGIDKLFSYSPTFQVGYYAVKLILSAIYQKTLIFIALGQVG